MPFDNSYLCHTRIYFHTHNFSLLWLKHTHRYTHTHSLSFSLSLIILLLLYSSASGVPESFVSLVDSILSGAFEEIRDDQNGALKAIKLTRPGLTWFIDDYSTLIVRDFYLSILSHPDMLNNFTRTPDAKMFDHLIILGNPGIGKSAFGMFVLFMALRLKHPVVYCSGKRVINVLVEDGNVRLLTSASIQAADILDKPSTVFINDTMEFTPYCNAFTFLITSPKRSRWYDYDKDQQRTQKLIFPPHTWEEYQYMNATCFHIDETLLSARFALWGGIPRFLFSRRSKEDLAELFEAAVLAIDVSKLHALSTISYIEKECEVSHRLLHFIPEGRQSQLSDDQPKLEPSSWQFYKSPVLVFASQEVAARVFTIRKESDVANMRTLLNASAGIPGLGVIRGNLFGYFAAGVLGCGGSFPIRTLGQPVEDPQADSEMQARLRRLAGAAGSSEVDAPSQVTSLGLPRMEIVLFSGVEELRSAYAVALRNNKLATTLFFAKLKNECAIDAVLPGPRLVNFTVAKQHPLIIESSRKRAAPDEDDDTGLAAGAGMNDSHGADMSGAFKSIGLDAVAEALQLTSGIIDFVFVVPQDIFTNSYTRRQPLKRLGRTVIPTTDPFAKRLIQHVLSIKLDSRSLVPDADLASKLFELGLQR